MIEKSANTIVSNNTSLFKNKIKKKDLKLTPLKILFIFIFEIIVETYYGISFFIAVKDEENNGDGSQTCTNLKNWCLYVAILYMTEIGVAFVCLVTGMLYFLTKRKLIIRLYAGITNFTKTIVLIINLTFLAIITYYYYTKDKACKALDDLVLGWMHFHFIMIGISAVSIGLIAAITLYIRSQEKPEFKMNDFEILEEEDG